jgi:hypothetical protein
MARPARTKAQRECDLPVIAKMHLQGRTQTDIAAVVSAARPYDIGHRTVCRDIATIVARWQGEAIETIGLAKRRELERLNVVEAEAWEAWRESKPVGDPRYLQIVLESVRRRCGILGLDDLVLTEIEVRIARIEGVRHE